MATEVKAARNWINGEIRARKVTLIDANGENKGLVDLSIALKEAYDSSLDLVQMSGDTDNIVCRIMDYGKYSFEAAKKMKQSQKESKAKNDVKEIRLSPGIDDHDLDIKSKQARRFIEDGKKVRIDIRMRGRERKHPEIAREVVYKFAKMVEDVAKFEEKGINYLLIPK